MLDSCNQTTALGVEEGIKSGPTWDDGKTDRHCHGRMPAFSLKLNICSMNHADPLSDTSFVFASEVSEPVLFLEMCVSVAVELMLCGECSHQG